MFLAPEDLALFRAQGFLVLPRLVSRADLDSLRRPFEELVRTGGGVEECDEDANPGDTTRKVRRRYHFFPDLHLSHPALARSSYRATCDGLARQVLGGDALLAGVAAYYKPACHGSTTPWHQDGGYVPPDYPESVTFWMPLDDVARENGCLHFIPGSHRWGLRPHRRRNQDPDLKTLVTDVAPEEIAAAVACPLPAGAATVHGLRVLHFSGPNLTAQGRRALILDYRLSTAPAAEC